ncbi:vesicle transport through interaction with t-SNAREs homolog 1B [Bufo bufo]|uniref:vesicle transport through interaction with t-SNAREs homolog 1B n=1 Tax=Bufo bufo TaxID=8384 RepID=UPI001ABDFF18|nr:vesicle transport through interaction with t-SNAREs homolog 1B [Bufo bufo]
MSSEHFETLHDLFTERYEQLQRMPQRLEGCRGEKRKSVLREFDKRHLEANEMLLQMEEELRGAPRAFQNQMLSKMRSYRKGLAELQREARSTNTGLATDDRRKGFYSAEDEQRARVDPQRALLLQGHESLNRTTDSIARSHCIAAETDAIGQDIVEELGGQREQLERTKDRLINTGENLSKSRKILRSMSRKIVTNKLLLSIIIILEVAILGGVVYFKFFRKA